MQIDGEELAATYRGCSDDELAAIAAEMQTLTDAARAALAAEIERRGLSGVQLERLHARELRREMRFDQKESLRRKRIRLGRPARSPKDWIWGGLILLVFLLFQWLWSRFH